MCGRFIDPNLRRTDSELSEIKIDPFPARRFNVKPTNDVLILGKQPLQAMAARWWLIPLWHNGEARDWKATTFNARIDQMAEHGAATSGTVTVGEDLVAEMEIMFSHIDQNMSGMQFPEHNFVFTEQFASLLNSYKDSLKVLL